jgi:hypothetical protein
MNYIKQLCTHTALTQHSRNTQHSTRNTQHSTLNTQHSTLNTQHSTLNTQHSTLSTQYSALSTQHSARGIRITTQLKYAAHGTLHITAHNTALQALRGALHARHTQQMHNATRNTQHALTHCRLITLALDTVFLSSCFAGVRRATGLRYSSFPPFSLTLTPLL